MARSPRGSQPIVTPCWNCHFHGSFRERGFGPPSLPFEKRDFYHRAETDRSGLPNEAVPEFRGNLPRKGLSARPENIFTRVITKVFMA